MENKQNSVIEEIEELKLIYYEIINGASFISENSSFLKHFSEKENYLVQKKKIELINKYKNQGIPNQNNILEEAIRNERWTKEKEEKILELKYAISDNEKNIINIIPQQRHLITREIDKNKEELSSLILEKRKALGKSLEDLVSDEINEYLSFLLFFKDEECKIQFFESFEAFEKIDFNELFFLNRLISLNNDRISDLQVKKIAGMPFFLNKFSYAKEDIGSFLGIPIYKLTYNQIHLFSIGVRNLNVLSNVDGDPPDISLDGTPDKIMNWYDIQHSILISKRKE